MKATSIQWNHDRLEVRFPGKPPQEIRAELKRRGFWWDGVAGCWWLARPVTLRFVRNEPVITDGFKYALDGLAFYCGLDAETRAAITKAHDFAVVNAAERSMEEACGIA
jgi:hypothetical protein